MNFGVIDGWVNGTERVVGDTTLSASASSITISGLYGDEDTWYTVIARQIYATSNSTLNMTFNTDTTAANYGYRGMTANNTSTATISSTASTIRLCNVTSANQYGFSIAKIYSKSGTRRIIIGSNICAVSSSSLVTQIEEIGSVWADTTSTITQLVFTPNAGHLGIGTRIIVLKSTNATSGTPCGAISTPSITGAWFRVGTQTLAATASSITFSNLDGDRDVVYYLTGFSIGASEIFTSYRPNNDTGNNYCAQIMRGQSTTVAAARDNPASAMYALVNGTDSGNAAKTSTILFAEKGYVRQGVVSQITNVNGTSVEEILMSGCAWNNTADNITSIVVRTSTNNFGIGTHFDLYALRPNG